MRLQKFAGGLFLMLALALVAYANPGWDGAYPQTGTNKGELVVKGGFAVPSGFKTTGTGYIIVCPVGGGVQVSQLVDIGADKEGNIVWGEHTISGLVSGTNYNVMVTMVTTSKTAGGTIINQTDTKQQKAK